MLGNNPYQLGNLLIQLPDSRFPGIAFNDVLKVLARDGNLVLW